MHRSKLFDLISPYTPKVLFYASNMGIYLQTSASWWVPGIRPKIPGLPRKIEIFQNQEPNQ